VHFSNPGRIYASLNWYILPVIPTTFVHFITVYFSAGNINLSLCVNSSTCILSSSRLAMRQKTGKFALSTTCSQWPDGLRRTTAVYCCRSESPTNITRTGGRAGAIDWSSTGRDTGWLRTWRTRPSQSFHSAVSCRQYWCTVEHPASQPQHCKQLGGHSTRLHTHKLEPLCHKISYFTALLATVTSHRTIIYSTNFKRGLSVTL